MPFVSQAQRAYMHIHHPQIANRWEEHTPKRKKLPEHVKKALDQLKGGLGDNKPDSAFDPKQLAMGRKVEMEHTDDPAKANEITKDHLTEFGNYYTALDHMEHKLKEGKTAAYRLGLHNALASFRALPARHPFWL